MFINAFNYCQEVRSVIFHSFSFYVCLADDGEDNEDLKHAGNGENGNLNIELGRNKDTSTADDITDTEQNNDIGKNRFESNRQRRPRKSYSMEFGANLFFSIQKHVLGLIQLFILHRPRRSQELWQRAKWQF